MKALDLLARLESAGSRRALWLNPLLTEMPAPIQPYDDPFLPFGKAIIAATRDLVAAYVFDLAAYLALGAAGAVALERTIAYAGDAVTVLHAPFVGARFVPAANGFGVDAVTLANAADADAYRASEIGAAVVEQATLVFLPERAPVLTLADVIYAGHGDDFAEQARAALLRDFP